MLTRLEFLQINLGRSKAASNQLEQMCNEVNPNIVCIQEPYLVNQKVVGIPLKYVVVASNLAKCAVIVRDNTCTIFPILVTPNIVAIKCSYQDKVFLIINTYIPPFSDFDVVLMEIDGLLRLHRNNPIIMTGDFNAKNTLWGGNITDDRGEQLSEFFLLHNIFVVNDKHTEATFETVNGSSWIDLSLTSGELVSQITHWEVSDKDSLSDHKYISFGFFGTVAPKIRKLTARGLSKLYEIIRNDVWLYNTIFPFSSAKEIEQTLTLFYVRFERWLKICEKNVKVFGHATPWWSEDLHYKRQKVNALRRRYQRCYNSEMRIFYKCQYLDYRKEYKDMIEIAKITSWQGFCYQATKASLFGIPYKLAFKKFRMQTAIPPICLQNNLYTDSHVESVKYILDSLYHLDDTTTDTLLLSNLRNSITIPNLNPPDLEFTFQEIDTVISTLRTGTAPGADRLTVPMVKQLWNYHYTFMHIMFNSCLQVGYFPKVWKIGKVVLLNKPGRPTNEASSYRPICLNSIFGKVLERLLYSRIYYFISTNNLLHPHQFGFTHNKSSTLALYNLVSHLQTLKSNGRISLLISLDFSGAFDSLCYPFVLHFLQMHQCPCNLYNLLYSFFKNRIVSYITQDKHQINKDVSVGCPQGSPLSPLLWNILISDLLNITFHPYVHIQAFADDVILVIDGLSRREIETRADTTLKLLHRWAQDRKLNFNYDKCFCMLIAQGTKYLKRNPIIKFNQNKLKIKPEIKILGVVFDSHLSFLPHVTYLKKKVLEHTVNLARFSACNWGINPTQFREIYLKSIERYIVYGAPVWWRTEGNSHLMRKIISVQRIPLLKICQAYHTVPNVSLPVLCNVIPINISLNMEVFMFKLFQARTPAQFNGWTVTPEEVVYPVDIWNFHPSNKTLISFNRYDPQTYESSKNVLHLYTDGSVCLGLVGAAFVLMKHNGSIVKIGKYCLPKHATIFDAEVVALIRGVEYLILTREERDCDIFTDSLSALQALANVSTVEPLICNLKHNIGILNTKCRVTCYFVKGHSGILGNELADQFASDARRRGLYTPMKKSKKYIKKQLIVHARDAWNITWSEQGFEKELFQWIPTISRMPDLFPSTYYLTQLLTCHGRFPFYFHRFKIKDHSQCFCGTDCQSIDHYFTSCLYTRSYINKLGISLTDPSEKQKIIHLKQKIDILKEMVQLINDNIE